MTNRGNKIVKNVERTKSKLNSIIAIKTEVELNGSCSRKSVNLFEEVNPLNLESNLDFDVVVE